MSDRDHNKSKSVLIEELEEAREELKQPPEWGNCRRGCSPAYLDREGFCSPACAMGAPRGEFVTVTQPTAHPGLVFERMNPMTEEWERMD